MNQIAIALISFNRASLGMVKNVNVFDQCHCSHNTYMSLFHYTCDMFPNHDIYLSYLSHRNYNKLQFHDHYIWDMIYPLAVRIL